MTVGELIEMLEDWPMDTQISMGPRSEWPHERIIGDPVLVVKDGKSLVLPDAMYIGYLDPAIARILGWS
jgi:hypothetical protein